MLSHSQVLFFEHENHGKNDFEMYRLSVKYDADTFAAEQQKLQENYQANASHRKPNPLTNADDDFYYDGAYYCCYTFFGETDYAFAYHTDPSTLTVSYLFFKDPISLSTMFAGPALSANKSSHVRYYDTFPQAQ